MSGDSDLEQCETEVSSLMQMISDLSKKMDSLHLQREMKVAEPKARADAPQQDLNPSAPVLPLKITGMRPNHGSKSVCRPSEEGSSELWHELQRVLSALEMSSGQGRKMLKLQTQNVETVQAKHLSAARESWVQATQVLDDMERDLGITYRSALPPDVRRKYQRDVLLLYKQNKDLSISLKCRHEELLCAERMLKNLEEEKNSLEEKLEDLKHQWLWTVGPSPPMSPSLSSSRTPSPCFPSQPYTGSPLLPRKQPGSRPDTPSSPSTVDSVLQAEIDRLQRCLERLKARNERLNSALVKRKGESEELSMSLSRKEADCSALNMALTSCEECEEAYVDLLSLCEARKHLNLGVNTKLTADRIESTAENTDVCSSCPPDGAANPGSMSDQEFRSKAGVILQRISKLKQDRAAVFIPQQEAPGQTKISPDTGTLAGVRGRASSLSSRSTKEEKSAIIHELVTVREDMSEMRGNLKLLEKEKRSMDLALMVQNAQDAAGSLILESLQEELGEMRVSHLRYAEYQATHDSGAEIPGPQNLPMLRELHSALQRERSLKKRVSALRDSLELALTDSTTQRMIAKEETSRLHRSFSKASNTYRSSRRKQQDQLWRLEKQISVMSERHASREAELQATLEAMEWRREETVL